MNRQNKNPNLYAQLYVTKINVHKFQEKRLETVGGVAFTRNAVLYSIEETLSKGHNF